MPLRKFRYAPEFSEDEADLPSLATDYDGYFPSPVHRMHDDLWAFADSASQAPTDAYPGWVRVGFPLAASGALWLGIYCLVRVLR